MDNGASSYRRFRDNGDISGFDEIVMDYSDGLMLYLTSIVGNIWTAEELTEETFFLLGTKKPNVKWPLSNPTQWAESNSIIENQKNQSELKRKAQSAFCILQFS